MSATIFVSGATGVLGRATIPVLLTRGYGVRALSRSESNDAAIRTLGAEPIRADLFDVASLTAAIADADAIFHLATRIPPTLKMRHRDAWRENDHIRAEGTRNLVAAAIQNGTTVFVYPSFAFVYPASGETWIDATTTPADHIGMLESTIAAEREVAHFASSDATGARRGIALRLGLLYGVTIPSTLEQVALARRGMSMVGGLGNAYLPTLRIDDAATALVAALESAPTGRYDVVDDEPLRHRELTNLMATAVDRRWLITPPLWLLRAAAGSNGPLLSRGLRISNRRFKEVSGWSPSTPSAMASVAHMLDTIIALDRPRLPVTVMAGLWIMALASLLAGISQQFTPRAFYDTFPGFGMQWVSTDGPFNEHLMRDLGGANLALALLIFFAIARPTTGLVRAICLAVLVYQVPHFIYHAAHLGLLPTSLDRFLQTASLALILLIPTLVLIGTRRISTTRRTDTPLDSGQERGVENASRRLIAPVRS